MSSSASKSIRQAITEFKSREPFTPSSFAGLGSRAAIDQTLMRLAKDGGINRVARGVYVLAEVSRFGLKAMPEPQAVAEMVAKNEGAQIGIHGAEAVRQFGLSTQAPTQPVFYTTGSSRRIKMDGLSIRLDHVAPRKLALGDRPAGQALSALWYLGKEHVTPETFEKIRNKISPAEFSALAQARAAMPGWMAAVLMGYEQGEWCSLS